MTAPAIDAVTLNFSPATLLLLNAILGLVTFGVALSLKIEDFAALARAPRKVLTGLASQFLFLPAATFALVVALAPPPSIAMGLMLVAACPGGNVSNFLCFRAGGNTALSVALTAISSLLAVLVTPVNLAFWAGLYGPTADLVRATAVDPANVALTVGLLLAAPLAAGVALNERRPKLALRLLRPMQTISMGVLGLFILGALVGNWTYLKDYLGAVFALVILHNAVAFAGGYLIALAAGLPERDRRAICVETGIQNSGLGLALIFNFFDGLGGMAVTAAFWGLWHLISGLALTTLLRRRRLG